MAHSTVLLALVPHLVPGFLGFDIPMEISSLSHPFSFKLPCIQASETIDTMWRLSNILTLGTSWVDSRLSYVRET